MSLNNLKSLNDFKRQRGGRYFDLTSFIDYLYWTADRRYDYVNVDDDPIVRWGKEYMKWDDIHSAAPNYIIFSPFNLVEIPNLINESMLALPDNEQTHGNLAAEIVRRIN